MIITDKQLKALQHLSRAVIYKSSITGHMMYEELHELVELGYVVLLEYDGASRQIFNRYGLTSQYQRKMNISGNYIHRWTKERREWEAMEATQ